MKATDLKALLEEFARDKLALRNRHVAAARTIADYETNNTYQYIINREDVQLRIYEPPRYYEAFLRGRAHTESPDITARICGICPVAYQTSACWAVEQACGISVPDEVRAMRRLLYCGEWIESHALHVHFLHAPDFLGYDGGIEMARDYPDEVNRGLRLKKHGNELLEVLGGRAIHPINVAVGGFFRLPRVVAYNRDHQTLETFTTSPVVGEWTILPPPRYMPTWWMLVQLLLEAKNSRSPGSIADRETVLFFVPQYWSRETRGSV